MLHFGLGRRHQILLSPLWLGQVTFWFSLPLHYSGGNTESQPQKMSRTCILTFLSTLRSKYSRQRFPVGFSSNNFQHLCFLLTTIGQSFFQAGLLLKIIIDDQQQRWDSKDEQMIVQCNHRVSGRPSRLKWCFLAFGQKEKFAAKRVADKTGEWLWWQQGNQMMLMLLKRIWPVNDEIDAWVENPHRVGEMAQTHNLRQKVRLPTGCLKRLKPNCAQKLNLVWSHPKWRDEVEGRKDLLDVLKIVVRLFSNSDLLKKKKYFSTWW